MNSSLLPPRNGHLPNGTGAVAADTNDSASSRFPNPSGAEIDWLHRSTGELADSPITPRMPHLVLPRVLTGETSPTPFFKPLCGALLWGPWKAETSASNETLAESVLQHLRGAVVVLDADLRVCLANVAFCEAFQFAPGQLHGRWFPELGVGNRSVPRLRELLDQTLIRDNQIEVIDVEHDVPTFGRRSLVIHARKLAGPGAGDTLILLEIEDVTEREAAEQQRRELIMTAVHELRNPLTAIKGYAQLMQKRQGTRDRALSTILEQAQQVSRLVDDLLAHSSSGIAQPCLDPRLIDLVTLARASVEQARLPGSGHVIRLESREESIQGFWDGGRLAQVFANLLGNAVKYSPADGEIVVRIHDLGVTVRVSISDQGVGIAADSLPRVFDQFYRVAATADQIPGLGLGLHVSKTLVEAHGGSIWAQSDPGAGSTFTFEIPCVAPAPSARAARLVDTGRSATP